jgi:hypothetical protein
LPAADAQVVSTQPEVPGGGRMTFELRWLEQQLRTAFEGAAWHGPAVLELLAGVTPEQAFARPIPGAHTIWELVLHLVGAYRLVLRRLRGDPRPLSPEEDWPTVPPDEPQLGGPMRHSGREAHRRLEPPRGV